MGRRLGQHFLVRPSILDRIARAACGEEKPSVVEIGPGKGALTGPLLEYAEKVIAIEVDPYLVHYLRQKFGHAIEAGRLELIEGDVLKIALSEFVSETGRLAIAGNLPYYITSPILESIFRLETKWERAVFLVQAEVAARLAASPETRDYGYLSVLAQLYSKPEILFEVPRAAFRPPPKVDSAAVRLDPRDAAAEWGLADRASFLRFAALCFHQKRKTLRNNLAPVYGRERVDGLPEGRLRAEQLSIPELIALHHKIAALSPEPA